MLGESIRAFAAEVENVTRWLAGLESGDPDVAAAATAAVERLRQAQDELVAEEEELRELLAAERLRYRDLFEWAPDAYVVTEPNGTIREANRAAERLLGHDREFLLGKPLADLLSDEDRQALRVMLARLPELELVADWEVSFERSGERVFPATVTVSVSRDREGAVGGLRWLIRDISERRAAEQQMVSANLELERRVTARTAELEALGQEKDEALARLEAVLDQIPAAIVIADAESGKVVAANEHAVRLVSEVAGHRDALDTWLSIGFRTDGSPFQAEERPIMRALASGEAVEAEDIEFLRLDGMRALFETSAAPVRNLDGEIVGAVAAYWDMTERTRLARAEREFVTNAAHELRTPLAALASAVEVLQSGAKEEPQQRDRFLAHVEQQSNRLQRLVRSLLLLARLQTRQEKPERETVPVGSLLEELAALGPRDRVVVELECPPDTVVVTNRDLAEQALLNLISNAAKYAPRGKIVLRSRSENGYVALEVVDTGPGMTDEEVERATQRFYRGREDAEGFGLGLSIAQQAAEALEGRLELESNGAGTRVRLLLPVAGPDA
jgi:PAS domain S-box-containing protein